VTTPGASWQAYVVGGAVRDALLGIAVQDRDWVVVGATPDDLLAEGFRPVGKDFPVFLHPDTHEEYALARTERKTAPGYRGFVFHADPGVTLEQDLVRRDLTINAIARAEDGTLIDPFGGQRDLAARLFRHVSDAFLEDPVRILRLARFAARLPAFRVAPETAALMRTMVAGGEVDALVAERVWQEMARGLMETQPSRMFAVLRECGALARIAPELEAAWDVPHPACGTSMGAHMMAVLDTGCDGQPLCVRFAALLAGLETAAIETLCQRLRVPSECRDLAIMTAREQDKLTASARLDADATVALFERCDGWRKPARFAQLLAAAAAASCTALASARLSKALAAALAVNAGAIAAACGDDKAGIPAAVRAARVAAVAAAAATATDESA
jgi:tRNA nucleotidyltransferase (CCA-adding enzyme)